MKLLKQYVSDVHRRKVWPIAGLRCQLRRQHNTCDIELQHFNGVNMRNTGVNIQYPKYPRVLHLDLEGFVQEYVEQGRKVGHITLH